MPCISLYHKKIFNSKEAMDNGNMNILISTSRTDTEKDKPKPCMQLLLENAELTSTHKYRVHGHDYYMIHFASTSFSFQDPSISPVSALN